MHLHDLKIKCRSTMYKVLDCAPLSLPSNEWSTEQIRAHGRSQARACLNLGRLLNSQLLHGFCLLPVGLQIVEATVALATAIRTMLIYISCGQVIRNMANMDVQTHRS
jgi:hypothetical protein